MGHACQSHAAPVPPLSTGVWIPRDSRLLHTRAWLTSHSRCGVGPTRQTLPRARALDLLPSTGAWARRVSPRLSTDFARSASSSPEISGGRRRALTSPTDTNSQPIRGTLCPPHPAAGAVEPERENRGGCAVPPSVISASAGFPSSVPLSSVRSRVEFVCLRHVGIPRRCWEISADRATTWAELLPLQI